MTSLAQPPVDAPPPPAAAKLRARHRKRADASHVAETHPPLEAFSRYQPRPGHPDWQRLAAEARELASRLRPQLDEPRRGRAERRRRAAGFATAARNYAINRRLMHEGREDLRPLYYIWTVTRACNFACEYCDDHRGRKYPDLPTDDVLDTADAKRLLTVMRTGTASVYFAGGEPTLRRDLPELTRAARDLDYYPIIVNTNASAFHRLLALDRWRSWLADIDIVVVSIDALDLATLGRMWVYRRPEDVLRNLLLLRELAEEMNVKLMVNTVIQPGAVQHAREVLDLVNDLGIWFCPVPMNVGPRIHPDLLEDPEYRALAELILERKRAGHRVAGSRRLNQRLLRAAPIECRNTLKPHVDHDGRLFWPCKACVNIGPEMVRVLDFDNLDAMYAHASGRIDPTRFCGPAINQCGAACNWAQNYSTDAYAFGLRHPVRGLVPEMLEFLRTR